METDFIISVMDCVLVGITGEIVAGINQKKYITETKGKCLCVVKFGIML